MRATIRVGDKAVFAFLAKRAELKRKYKLFGEPIAPLPPTRNCVTKSIGGILMKKLQFLCLSSALAIFLGISASAQSTPGSAPDAQTPPAASDQSQPASTPDAQTQPTPGQTPDQANKPMPEPQTPPTTSAPTDTQSFSGTIVKSGDKYMLQDEASGKTYDIDHQDEVQKFDGKRVKVKGTLDASGKTIHLQ
jgi:hypothetical protein